MTHVSFMLTLFIMFSIQIPLTAVTSVIDGLKRLYIEKLKPLEVAYKFNDFVSPLLVNNCIFRIWFLCELQMTFRSLTVCLHFLLLSLCGITFSKLLMHKITTWILQTNSDFDAKPMVMLLGQYSTGKTTFIKHLLKTSYPGYVLAHVFPVVSGFNLITCHDTNWQLIFCFALLQVPILDQSQQPTDLLLSW